MYIGSRSAEVVGSVHPPLLWKINKDEEVWAWGNGRRRHCKKTVTHFFVVKSFMGDIWRRDSTPSREE